MHIHPFHLLYSPPRSFEAFACNTRSFRSPRFGARASREELDVRLSHFRICVVAGVKFDLLNEYRTTAAAGALSVLKETAPHSLSPLARPTLSGRALDAWNEAADSFISYHRVQISSVHFSTSNSTRLIDDEVDSGAQRLPTSSLRTVSRSLYTNSFQLASLRPIILDYSPPESSACPHASRQLGEASCRRAPRIGQEDERVGADELEWIRDEEREYRSTCR